MAWGMLLFAAYGLTDFTFKIQVELEPSVDPSDYMLIIFGTAMLLTVARLFRGARPTRDCLFWGSALGATNVMTTYFRIRTLAELPGAVAFPTLGLGVIAVSTVASLAIWKETLRPANFAFLALASVAVLLINMG
jgi:multidrug transporter EmrE-like cation transporter